MEEGMTIAKVPDWLELKPEMMRHLNREHEKRGRTLTEEEKITLLRSLGFESAKRSDEDDATSSRNPKVLNVTVKPQRASRIMSRL